MATKAHAVKSRKVQALVRRRQEKIRNGLFLVGALVAVIAFAWLFLFSTPRQNVVPARVGAEIGNFTLSDIHGKVVQLSDYKGKPVLINAWATWCPPCKAEMPLLNQYYKAHAAQGFVLLAVNAGDSQAQAESFANDYGLTFPVLLDPGTRLLNQMAINSFPTSILLGKDGKVAAIHSGMFTTESIEAEITPHITQ